IIKEYYFMHKDKVLVMLITAIRHATKGQGRDVINLNARWKLRADGNLQYRHTSVDETKSTKLNLPESMRNVCDLVKHSPGGNAGGALPGVIGWYRKTFDLEKKDINKSVFIYFGGVYRYAEVWINGIYLGKNYNGYLSFEKELTKYLNYGDKSNVIAIRADNSLQPNSRWYSGSGIYRDVKLEKRHKSYLLKNETILTTPIVDVSQSTLNVSSKIFGQGELVKIELSDKNNKLLAQQEVRVKNDQIEASLNINSTILWSPENPYLYQVKISLLNNKKEKLDDLTYSIGFRHFKFEVNEGFELNGVKTKILGVCL